MFKVDNADFIADKLATELLPNQEFREVYKNAEEAIQRRVAAEESAREGVDSPDAAPSALRSQGRIEFDVDWGMLERTAMLDRSRQWLICCADDGDGMSRSELQRYTTTLAVMGAGQSQSLTGNQGMGLKVAGPTRHRQGVLIRTLQAGEASMVQVGWSGSEYDLIPLGPNGEKIVSPEEASFPEFILERGSGTVVTFLGNDPDANTFLPGTEKGWLFRYLNRRFFQLSQDGIEVFVRVPSGEIEDWPSSREEAASSKSFNFNGVDGTATIWNAVAEKQGSEYRGVVSVQGDPTHNVPPADIHWWVLPAAGPGSDVTSRTYGGGSLAVLHQNELHDWRVGAHANAHFARLGVIFGKNRIAFIIEPKTGITSDFARAHVLVGETPVFEHDAWHVWSEQFRSQQPEIIQKTMADEQARLQQEDPDRARRIRDRLKDVMQLLRPRKVRTTPRGATRGGTPEVSGPGDDPRGNAATRTGGSTPRGTGKRGIGSVLTQVDDGDPAEEVYSVLNLQPQWVSEEEADGFSIVHGNGQGLRDRAAALAGEDAATAPVLLLNREFRGYQSLLAALNDFANPEGNEDKAAKIEAACQEWVDQKMIEAVHGMRQLENGKTWLTTHFDEALSPIGLTAAFMADRYHTLAAAKRAIGPLRK